MRQHRKLAQDIQIRQFGKIIRRQDQIPQSRDRSRQAGLDDGDSVAGEQEGADARREGEVAEDLDVVVGEVEGVVGLCAEGQQLGKRGEGKGKGRRTPATPRFSMAGIL